MIDMIAAIIILVAALAAIWWMGEDLWNKSEEGRDLQLSQWKGRRK